MEGFRVLAGLRVLESMLSGCFPNLEVRMLRGMALITLGWLATSAEHAIPELQLRSFQTPSGNIGCIADSEGGWQLRCDVAERNWTGQHPRGCDLDSGDAFGLGRNGRPYWVCHGDTVLHSGAVLAYGSTWHAGPFSCVSAREGVTCRSASHGFMLSRARYSVW
jgi:hypothetical protein